jgi:hypothetical protein
MSQVPPGGKDNPQPQGNSNSGKRPAVKQVSLPARIPGVRTPGAAQPAPWAPSNAAPPGPSTRGPGMPAKPTAAPAFPPRPMRVPNSMPQRPIPAPSIPAKPPTVVAKVATQTLSAPSRSSVRRMAQQRCSDCSRMLSHDSIAAGEAVLSNGILTCAKCLKRKAADRQHRSLIVRIAIGCGMLLLAVGVLFPALFLLITSVVATLAIFSGILGFTLTRPVRAGLCLGGAVFLAVSIFGISYFNARKENQRLNAVLAADADAIEKLIKEGHGIEAEQRINKFRLSASGKSGDYATPEAVAILQRLTQDLDKWYEHTYGVRTLSDKELVQRLIFAFGERTKAGSQRFVSAGIDGSRAIVSAVLPSESISEQEGSKRNFSMEEGGRLARFIANAQPKVNEVEITLFSDNEKHDEISKILFTKAMIQNLESPVYTNPGIAPGASPLGNPTIAPKGNPAAVSPKITKTSP